MARFSKRSTATNKILDCVDEKKYALTKFRYFSFPKSKSEYKIFKTCYDELVWSILLSLVQITLRVRRKNTSLNISIKDTTAGPLPSFYSNT